ncbi:MAG: ACT domain-containing protein [Oscillospiraceae bacterium]|nr:ACT domain-containing protein [Oscillospiraceae bacterium]
MVPQLSVFLQNKSGKIAAITRALSDNQIDIRALSIADTTDFGILRMLVSDIRKAKEVLTGQNCILSVNEVVVVAVPDRTGGLAEILSIIAEANVDIEYMYSLIGREDNMADMVFRVSNEEAFRSVLQQHGLQTISAAQLGLN